MCKIVTTCTRELSLTSGLSELSNALIGSQSHHYIGFHHCTKIIALRKLGEVGVRFACDLIFANCVSISDVCAPNNYRVQQGIIVTRLYPLKGFGMKNFTGAKK